MANEKNPDEIVYNASDPVLDAAMRKRAWAELKRKDKKAPFSVVREAVVPSGTYKSDALTLARGVGKGLAQLNEEFNKFYRERNLGGIERKMKLAAQRAAGDPSESNKDAYKSWKEAYGKTISIWEKENGRKYTRIDQGPSKASVTPDTNKNTGDVTKATGPKATPPGNTATSIPRGPTAMAADTAAITKSLYGQGLSTPSDVLDLAGSVNVPGRVATNTPMGPNMSNGIVRMSQDKALKSFTKSLYEGSADALDIVAKMNKFGIDTSRMNKGEIAAIYQKALEDTSTAISSGVTGYNVLKSLEDMGSGIGSGSGGSGGGGAPRSTTSTSYSKKVYTEDEFRTVGNAVSQNLLGRLLSDDEITKALAAANAESMKTPDKTVTKTRINAGGTSSTSNSTTSGGFNLQGSLQEELGNTSESQAYTTNNVFNDAMRILASRIG